MISLILVDTSVIIGYLKGLENPKIELFEKVLKQKVMYGISSYTYQEVLQGSRDNEEFNKLNEYLSTQKIYFLPESIETYESGAKMFYNLRKAGITIRSTIDILIALTAIEYDLSLLHNDRDFEMIKAHTSNFKTISELF